MLLTHPNDAARLGAASAAGAIGGEQVAAGCLKAAVDDENADVRRAAAHSFASIADPANVRALTTALTTRKTRRRAFEVLAELHRTPAAAELSPYWRVRAAWRSRRRVLKRSREEVRSRTIRGALAGLLASVAWAVTSGFAFVSVQSWTSGSSGPGDVWSELGPLGLGVIIAGPIVGAVIARMAARRAALSAREGRWLRPFVTVASFVLVMTLLLAILAFTASAEAAYGVLAVGAGVAAGTVLVGAYVLVFRCAMWPATNTRGVALWGVLIGFGPPLLVMIELLAHRSTSEFALLVVVPLSVVATVTTIVLADTPRADRLPGTALPGGMRKVVSRSMLVLAAIFAPLSYLATFGVTYLPFAAPRYVVGSVSVAIRLPANRDISYFRLRPADNASWAEVNAPSDLSVMWGTDDILSHHNVQPAATNNWSTLLLVPPGGVTLIARRSSTSEPSELNGTLNFSALHELSANTLLPLDSVSWTPFVVILKPSSTHPNKSVWKRKLRLQSADPSQDTIVRIAIPWNGNGRAGTLSQGLPGIVNRIGKGIEFRETGPTFTRYNRVVSPLVAGGKDSGSLPDAPQELSPVLVNSKDGTFDIDLEFSSKSSAQISIPVLLARQPRDELARASHEHCEQLTHAENYNAALPYCEEDADWGTDDPLYLTEHAWTLLNLSRSAEALPLARKAADLVKAQSGLYVDVFDTLARAEYDNGNWARAVQAWQMVYALAPIHGKTASGHLLKGDNRARFEDAKRKAAAASQPQ
jgi:hypothetical protein